MLDMQRRDQDALIRIRIAVVNQEQALAKQMAQREAFKTGDEHMAMYQEEFKGTGGFAGADPKKRRGVSSGISSPFTPSSYFLFPGLTPCLTPCQTPHTVNRVWLTITFSVFLCKRRPLLFVATAVTEPKHPNGVGVQMVPEHYVTPAVCTTPS